MLLSEVAPTGPKDSNPHWWWVSREMVLEVKERYQSSLNNYIDQLEKPTLLGHFGLTRISELLPNNDVSESDYEINEEGLISFKNKLYFLDSSVIKNYGDRIYCRRLEYEKESK